MKRQLRFEKPALAPTCNGFCSTYSPIHTVREPLISRFIGLFREAKPSIRNARIASREDMVWARMRGEIEGNDTPLSSWSLPLKWTLQKESRWAA